MAVLQVSDGEPDLSLNNIAFPEELAKNNSIVCWTGFKAVAK